VSGQVTVYAILPGRGYEQSVMILGAEYDGFLIHDGWAPYYRLPFAFHQSCLAHLLKRCREMGTDCLTGGGHLPVGSGAPASDELGIARPA
jgi:transposase